MSDRTRVEAGGVSSAQLAPARPGDVVRLLRSRVLRRGGEAYRPRAARAQAGEVDVVRGGVVERARVALAAVVEGGGNPEAEERTAVACGDGNLRPGAPVR